MFLELETPNGLVAIMTQHVPLILAEGLDADGIYDEIGNANILTECAWGMQGHLTTIILYGENMTHEDVRHAAAVLLRHPPVEAMWCAWPPATEVGPVLLVCGRKEM